jgi:hypothetical protein
MIIEDIYHISCNFNPTKYFYILSVLQIFETSISYNEYVKIFN